MNLAVLLPLFLTAHLTHGQLTVTQIQPITGSVNGGTRITIEGQGFADANQFDYGDANPNLGNSVQLVSSSLSIPCDVEKDASHATLITCYTRPMPADYYTVRVSVDGVPVDTQNICSGYFQYWWCMFQTTIYYTPVINSITPQTGSPGPMITIKGTIFTDVYGSNTALSSNGKNVRVLRVYAGGMPCNLLVPNSDTLYGLQLDSQYSDTGSMICYSTGTYVGHLNISFILDSNYGRSLPSLATYFVSSLNKIAMFQTYAVITGVFPSAGSTQGGTILTISGQYFDQTDAPAKVLVGGQECLVLGLTDTTITCRTPPKPPVLPALFPGSRGLKMERWNTTASMSSWLKLNENSTGYAGASWFDGGSRSWPLETSAFIARFSGFFVPPETDYYNFYLRGDDDYALYFNETGDPAGKVRIAYGHYTTSYFTNPYQKSQTFLLKKGNPCYFEAYIQNYYGPAGIDVGVYKRQSSYTDQQTADAVNEVQTIQSRTDTVLEQQIITLQNWNTPQIAVHEVQTITVTKYCISPCPPMYYTLAYGTEETGLLSADATADDVQSALNQLWSIQPDTVAVTQEASGVQNVYSVTFISQRGDFQLLTYNLLYGSNITVDIEEKTQGVSDMQTFTLVWDNVYSTPLPVSASSAQVQSAILGMVSALCPDAIDKVTESFAVKYFRNYETDFSVGSYERGFVTSETEAFCGRHSLQNPSVLYDSTENNIKSKAPYGSISLTLYSQLCFAYNGLATNSIGLSFQYEDSRSLGTVTNVSASFKYNFVQGNSWTYTCIDLLSLVKTQYSGRNFNVLTISLASQQDYYVDVLYIGQTKTTSDYNVVRRAPALSAHGIILSDVTVVSTVSSTSRSQYTITITPYNCGYNFPLFAIGFAENMQNTSNSALYGTSSWTQGSSIQINRTQAASPPIGGTFSIQAYGKEIKGLAADISAVDLKYALETIPEIGQVSILSSSGNCRGYTSQIKFLTATGYQPLLQVNDSSVTGVNAAVSAVKVTDGGLFRQHLLGDLLRTAHRTPQVEVYINGLPSQCTGDCGYTWSAQQTPVINSLNTVLSGGDQLLIISGSGFSDGSSNDTTSVTIGNLSCTIRNLTANNISCLVPEASAGTFPVTVYIAEVGFAVSSGVDLSFTYQLAVSSIAPSLGSLAGGTLVTILGMGFSGDTTVELGSSSCDIVFASLDMIQCRTSAGSPGTIDVVVSTNGLNGTLPNAYSYTEVSAPTITDISPTSSSVLGNTTLIILGFNFGGQTVSNAVVIGNQSCQLLEWNETYITCLLPALPPGTYDVLVEVEGWGFAISNTSSEASITYVLEVMSIFPQYGSLYGGSQITVTGAGFSSVPGDNQVTIGSLPCVVSASSINELACEIQSPGNKFYVTNAGVDAVYGLGYAWSPPRLDISTGDTVIWQWQSQPFIMGIGYRVFSVSGPSNLTYDGISFNSGARTPSGAFSYQFTSPGTYYYSSGYVNDAQTIFMQGTIDVSPISDYASAVNVSVGGIEASYFPALRSFSAPDDCTTPDPPCPQLPNLPPSSSLLFGFSSCYSPSITSITPNSGTIYDPITINGTGFSNLTCANQVSIGSYPCVVSSADENSITCNVDPQGSMAIGVAELVSLKVNNHGNAINTLTNELARRFALLPEIDYITPTTGSVTGSTRITIHGSGFSNINDTTTITGLGCTILSVNYTDIVCDTLPSYAISVDVEVTINGITTQCQGSCSYMYSSAMTPNVSSVYPTVIRNTSTTFYVSGLGFGTDVNDIAVYVGGNLLNVVDVNDTEIISTIDPIPAGNYPVTVIVHSKGLAEGSFTVNSPAEATLLTESGSVAGGTLLRIEGNGFYPTNTTVKVDGTLCPIIYVTPDSVECFTPPSTAAKTATVSIYIPSVSYPPLSFLYSEADTPTVTSVLPNTGPSGTNITVSGSLFGSDDSTIAVIIGNATCSITAVSDSQLTCTVGDNWGGTFPVTVINEKGYARSSATFTYELSINSVSPNQGSFGGGLVLTISGSGFAEQLSNVLVCNSLCTVDRVRSNASSLFCEVPASNDNNTTSQSCDVRVMNGDYTVQMNNSFSYSSALTPVIYDVTPKRGGTAGGTRLTITGSQFSTNMSRITVTIAQATCHIQSSNSTQIVCITSAQSPSQNAKVRVYLEGQGIAKLDNADFFYIDVWSSIYTWGGQSPPDAGSLAVITEGQTILLDQSTPVLKMLLIQGGTLIFDEADIELKSENILITNGGKLQIGTEEAPFQHKAIITLYGQIRSPELPLYGAKTLAVRQGTLDLHGIPIPVTWTRLAQTAEAGSSTLILEQSVTWKPGDEIVVASTGGRLSQRETEKRTIYSVSPDGKNVTLTEPLLYEHLGISVTLPDNTVFEARAEVGVLTRNILIRGNTNEEWSDTIPACPDGFDPGEFATQTCYQGRFGEEIGSDQFGGCIMFHAPEPDKLLSIGRIEYVEVFHAGQAFRLGRYPIHWHLLGDVQFTSYVRGCGIHQTYNRAVTIHNTHNLLVEKTVIYDIMGGAFFIEDGIEHGNILQYNLALFVKQSTSLLNDDVTPAGYWVTNPNNIIRHNAAAGGTHFGFWYRMHQHPDGPSYDPNICQQLVPLGEFYNNTVHSQGWYGIWIFEKYYPVVSGSCTSTRPSPAIFTSLTTWNCQKGAEWVDGGALQFHNFTMVNNEVTGIETKRVISSYVSGWGESGGAVLKNAIIVGYLDELGLGSDYCTSRGITLPFDEGLTVSSVKFMNFDRLSCSAIAVTSIQGLCSDRCGGWSAKFDGIQYFNTSNKAGFRWEHEVVLIDTDGTLTGKVGAKVVPGSGLLDPSQCSQSNEWSAGFPGYVCNSTVSFHRLAFGNPTPSSLRAKNAIISNSFGISVVPFLTKRLTYAPGWMALLPNANSYNWYFQNAAFITNISYTSTFYGFESEDYVLISHNLTQRPDRFKIIDVRNESSQPLSWSNNSDGDWYFNDNTTTLTYLVSGKRKVQKRAVEGMLDPTMTNTNVNLVVYQCYFQNCVPPPPPTPATLNPSVHDLWSNNSFWESSAENNYTVPQEGSDVVIPPGTWVVADEEIPPLHTLIIYGVLELRNLTANSTAGSATSFITTVLSATYISIQGGRLIGGTESDPFQGELQIILRGNHSTPEFPLPNGPNQGSKVIGVFGELDLHGLPRSVYRTKLAETAPAGSQHISLVEPVDWKVGEDILITTTSYSAWQTETRRIVAVSLDQTSLTLNASLNFTHSAITYEIPNTTLNYTLAGDVALLSRNVKIIGQDYPGWYSESFGARVFVSTFSVNNLVYQGHARIENVEFYHSGQEGYRDPTDPRYSVAFLNLGEVSSNDSYVKGCAFHNGFSPAIGVFYTNGIDIDDNTIHFTVGEGIRIWGERVNVRGNLVALSVWPGNYQNRQEKTNTLWHAGIEINSGTNIVLQNNVVAGFERVGYRINGEPCPGSPNPNQEWFNNEAHGGLYGVYMNEDGLDGCSLIRRFTVWRCWDYGIYIQIIPSVQISEVLLADNGMGVLPIIYTPASVTHEYSNKTVHISNALLIGSSPDFDCSDVLTNSDPNIELSVIHRSSRPLTGGRSGINWPTFASGQNGAPGHPHAGIMNYNAISGLLTVEDTTFVAYRNVCAGETNVMFMTNPENEDLQHPIEVSRIQIFNSSVDQKVFIHRPDVAKANPSDCVDMTCDAKRKALLKDLDGSFLGVVGAVVPQSEYQWNGDPRYGLGDYRIPTVMLTSLNGSRIPVSQVAPGKGSIRDSTCVYMSAWESYKCSGLNYEMLVIESLDVDTETRRLSPVAILEDGYVDLINGPQDHGWCSGYTCQKRVSLFHAIVATNKTIDIFFTSTSPQNMRLMMLNADNSKAVIVGVYFSNPQRLDVYVNGVYINPTNIQWVGSDFTTKTPTYNGQYMPQLNSSVLGENYFDSNYNMLYILVRGSSPVEIHTSPLIVVAFNLPALTVDQFYGANLVTNLALFLKIPASKIRITKIIPEGSRRRKRSAGGLTVSVQISDPPAQNRSAAANSTDGLSYSNFVSMSQSLALAAINGSLSTFLNVTVSSLSVSTPVPAPGDPGWSEVASLAVNRTESSGVSFLATVSALRVITQPEAGLPGQVLSQQPCIMAVDSNGNCISVSASSLSLTATLKDSNGNVVSDGLGGNTTILFESCYANFTDLVLKPAGKGYSLEFVLNNVYAQTRSFDARSSSATTRAATPGSGSSNLGSVNSAAAICSPFPILLVVACILIPINLLMTTL